MSHEQVFCFFLSSQERSIKIEEFVFTLTFKGVAFN